MTEPNFYVVWNPARGLPHRQHDTFESARREAERLAAQHSGQQFWVLGAIGMAQTQSVVWRDCNNIPF